MKKLFLFLLLATQARAVTIVPGSSFPIVTTPSNYMRLLGVDTNGGTSSDPNTKSNFTVRYDDLKNSILQGPISTTLSNATIQYAKTFPQVTIQGVGQVKYAGPFTLTNTLSYGFTNLHVFDNVAFGTGTQFEIIEVEDGHTIRVFEPPQNVDPNAIYYAGAATNYGIYYNSVNLYDVNTNQSDYTGHTHGAITSDGGIGLATGQYVTGWGYGLRLSGGTNSWRISADNLGVYGPILNFLVGGDNAGNPFVLSAMAPYESMSMFPDGTVSFRVGISNRFGDLNLDSLTTNVNIKGNVNMTNGNVSIASARFLARPSNSGNVGQIKYSSAYTITNTLSYGFTNLHVFDNLAWGVGSQVEIMNIIDGHTVRVFEPVQNVASGSDYYLGAVTNYAVYFNSANLYDVNGAHVDSDGFTHGAITSDGGIGLATGGDVTGYSFGLRLYDKTNGWRILATSLGVYGPGLNFLTGGDSTSNPFFISGFAPFESMKILPDGNISAKVGLTNDITGTLNVNKANINIVSNTFPSTTTFVPPVGSSVTLWNSNKTFYLVTSTGTNPIPGSSTAGSLPADALGVLTNNGSGTLGWSTAFPSNWINNIQGLMDSVSNNAVSGLPSRTNFYQVTNATAGQALVIVGPDVNGQFYGKGTNWPTSGAAFPLSANGNANQFAITNLLELQIEKDSAGPVQGVASFYVTNYNTFEALALAGKGSFGYMHFKATGFYAVDDGAGAPSSFTATNAGVASIMNSNSVTTGTGTFNGGPTSLIPTNASPVFTFRNPSGFSLPMGITNILAGRAQPVVQYYVVDAVGGVPQLTASNETTAVKLLISTGASASITPETNWFTLPITTTNTIWKLRDESTGTGASVGVITNFLIGL